MAAEQHHAVVQAVGAAKGIWWNSNELLYLTIPLFQSSLNTFDDYVVGHLKFSKTEKREGL